MSDNSATETPPAVAWLPVLSRLKEICGLKAAVTGSEHSKRCIMRLIAKDVDEMMKAQKSMHMQTEFQAED
jgi:hypothetical protein